MENDAVLGSIWFALLALGAIYYFYSRYKKAKKLRQEQEIRADFARRREQRDDKRPTMVEQLHMEITALRSVSIRGRDLTIDINNIIARLEMEDDLGRYADGPWFIEMDQQRRDILLAHARRDAAEALANSKSVLREVQQLRRELGELSRYALIGLFVVIGSYYWRHGLTWWH